VWMKALTDNVIWKLFRLAAHIEGQQQKNLE
jgi:hypothetical protein